MITKHNILLLLMIITLSCNSAFGLSWTTPFRYTWKSLIWAFHEYRPSTVAENRTSMQDIRADRNKIVDKLIETVASAEVKIENIDQQLKRSLEKALRNQAMAVQNQRDNAIIKETIGATRTTFNEIQILNEKSKADLASIRTTLTTLQRHEASNKASLEEMKVKSQERLEKITKIEDNYRILLPLLSARNITVFSKALIPPTAVQSKNTLESRLDLD